MKKIALISFFVIGSLVLFLVFMNYQQQRQATNLFSPPPPRPAAYADQPMNNQTTGFEMNSGEEYQVDQLAEAPESQEERSESTSTRLTNLIKEKVSYFRGDTQSYKIVDTGVTTFYNNNSEIGQPNQGAAFYGQDAQYQINMPNYTDNGDGTVTDNITDLMWQKDMGEKMTISEAQEKAASLNLGGHTDWRIPSIKELYSLIQFAGQSGGEKAMKPFIDEQYFIQPLGDVSQGEREIDAQTWSSTRYRGVTLAGMETQFGVNFIDGRIKGYPVSDPRTKSEKKMYFRFVRGNEEYGQNNFTDNGDGTISDTATGLMWQKSDSGQGMNWESALSYAQKIDLAGYSDWRLPSAKELQSIVDYSRSPQETNSAAIDSIFEISQITDEKNEPNYPFFWTSTTHLDGPTPSSGAVYVSFGEAIGKMNGQIIDVHGAGAQRSDPKTGSESDYPKYHGPQGDVQRVFNYVRAVRSIQ